MYFSSDVFIEVYITWNARYFVSYFYVILKFLLFLYFKEPAERERRQITAASSHSFTRVAVTTVALPKTAIGHGALWHQTMIETRDGVSCTSKFKSKSSS